MWEGSPTNKMNDGYRQNIMIESIKRFCFWAVLSFLVGGTTTQCLCATPTWAGGSYVTRPKNVLGMNYLFEVRSNISHFMKVAFDGKSFNNALQYKTDTKFIEALEDGLLADNQAIRAINEKPELVDEYHAFYTQTKGTLAEFLAKGGDDVASALKQFDVAGEFAKGKNVVEFSIEWGGQSYKLTWSKINGKIDFGDRSQLARILGTSNDIEAHHLISWTKGGQHRVVQSAANDGFHLNMVENGLGLKKYTKLTGEGLHGNHPAYDDFLTYKLDEFAKGKSEFTAREANDFLQTQLIPEVKTHISNAGNTQLNLNEYFKQIVNKNTGVSGY